MTKKEKELYNAIELLKGKKVRITTTGGLDRPCLEGTVRTFTGSYLVFKDDLRIIHSGALVEKQTINARDIARIEEVKPKGKK